MTQNQIGISLAFRILHVNLDFRSTLLRCLIGMGGDVLNQFREINRVNFGPCQFGIKARGIGNIRDQSVHALHVMNDDFDELALLIFGLGIVQGFNRAAQRGERVLQLMRHICRKGFDGGDAVVKRLRHMAQRTGELADLIGA